MSMFQVNFEPDNIGVGLRVIGCQTGLMFTPAVYLLYVDFFPQFTENAKAQMLLYMYYKLIQPGITPLG